MIIQESVPVQESQGCCEAVFLGSGRFHAGLNHKQLSDFRGVVPPECGAMAVNAWPHCLAQLGLSDVGVSWQHIMDCQQPSVLLSHPWSLLGPAATSCVEGFLQSRECLQASHCLLQPASLQATRVLDLLSSRARRLRELHHQEHGRKGPSSC